MDPTDTADAEVERFKAELAASLAKITEHLRTALERAHRNDDGTLSADAFNLTLVRETGDQVAAMLGDSFTEAQASFRQAAAGLAHVVGADLEDQGLSPQLTDISAGAIQALAGHGVDDLAEVSLTASAELRDVLRECLTTGLDPTAAMDALAAKMDRTVAQATSLVDTSLVGLDRTIVVEAAGAAGVEWWALDGPTDSLTRPWCADRVGRRFTRTDMDRQLNDSGPNPPSVYGGGWNCRHRWVALQVEDLGDFEPFY